MNPRLYWAFTHKRICVQDRTMGIAGQQLDSLQGEIWAKTLVLTWPQDVSRLLRIARPSKGPIDQAPFSGTFPGHGPGTFRGHGPGDNRPDRGLVHREDGARWAHAVRAACVWFYGLLRSGYGHAQTL